MIKEHMGEILYRLSSMKFKVCVCVCLNIIHRIAKLSPQSPLLSVHIVILYFCVGPGPCEGWRGEDQGRVRSASGGHAERLPYIGRIISQLSRPFQFSSLTPPLQNHIPPPRIPEACVLPCAPLCE